MNYSIPSTLGKYCTKSVFQLENTLSKVSLKEIATLGIMNSITSHQCKPEIYFKMWSLIGGGVGLYSKESITCNMIMHRVRENDFISC